MLDRYPIVLLVIIGVVLIYSLLQVLFPKFMWRTFESWKSTKEPTKTFFIFRRIIGVCIFCFVSFICYFVSHIDKWQ